ncbi:MAG: GNAT family N-acetyltransferase [Bacteroidota bacterium]|nr:GNAT family N-acetyltransferase [Bacteroidota bacterium]
MDYPDIYFEPAYAELYKTDDKQVIEYKFECEYGLITNLFIKRRFGNQLENGNQYYEIRTPYGYGGPIIHNFTDADKLIDKYAEDMELYTQQNNIVKEFIRFHPIIKNASAFGKMYNIEYNRKTVGTNLAYDDVIGTEFSKHKRKDIKRILSNPDIEYVITECPNTLDDFLEVYYSTMKRDKASEYYYFKKEYFDKLLKLFVNNIITCKVTLREKVIAMGVYFRYKRYLHAHLSGTITEYIEYSPAYILKYAMAIYGKDNGYEIIHYGGGTTTDPDDSLLKFKKDFGKNTVFDFYIAEKIWNQEVYFKLNEEERWVD